MTEFFKKRIKNALYTPVFFRDIPFFIFKLGYWRSSWRMHKLPIIQKHKTSIISIKEDFKACSDPKKNSIGVFQKVIIKALIPNSKIYIGKNVGMSGATISGRNIKIGNNVLIGSGVLITDSDAHPIHPDFREKAALIVTKPIVIEDDVFIGARSIILKGVYIGRGSVIGAGSVVVSNIPEMSIAAGNPAKVVKKIE